MSRVVVGVLGHVDHGKTALTRALTGQDTDRLPEEKVRGISITLGFAHLDGKVDLIDMPGHERFVRTMISGATGIDAVLLVVAANEGVQPQTVEHVGIAGLLGIRQALVVVSKCDLVPREQAELVGADAAALLARNGITPLPLAGGVGGGLVGEPRENRPSPSPSRKREGDPGAILTSAVTGQGIAELRQALRALAEHQRPRSALGSAWLPIDRAFAIPGHGPVVTGTLRGAPLAVGDRLELLPSRRKLRVRALQVHGAAVASAQPGQRVAVNLRGVELGQLARGMALAAGGALDPAEWLTIAVRSVPGAPALKNGARLRALFGTQEAEARLRLLDRDSLEPGERAFAQLRLTAPRAIPAGEHVILRRASPALTLAGGRVLEPDAQRLRRHDGAVLDRLELLRDGSPGDVIAAEVVRAGSAGTTIRHLARLTALVPARVADLLRALPVVVSRTGGVQPQEQEQSRKRLAPRSDPERIREDAERALQICELLRRAGLTPPLPKEIVVDAPSHRAAELLLREGVLIRANDRDKGKELLFHRDAIAEARRLLAPLLGAKVNEGMLVSEIAAVLGISRKFCMPLLDHLDAVRFTRRVSDHRVLWEMVNDC